MKKKVFILFIFLVVSFSLESCTNSNKYAIKHAADKMELSYNSDKEVGYQDFLNKLDNFALKLTFQIYNDSDKSANTCISPVSVYMALALATECSNGKTREEILNAVGVTYEEVKVFTKYLYAYANKEYYYENVFGKDKICAFEELSNSIWINDTTELLDIGVNSLANNYNCDIFKVPFLKRTSTASKTIQKYIKNKTHGLIDSHFEFSPETLVALINTFYLKEIWNKDGDELTFTTDYYDFVNDDGSIKKTKLLNGYYIQGKAYTEESFSSFYVETNHGFQIKFILPSEGYSLEEVFITENLAKINHISDYGYIDHENKQLHYTRALFPEFKSSFDEDIANVLKKDFGIISLFSSECDFSNITLESVYCSSVIHKCSLEVNKKGIEGAAVTIMPMCGESGPIEESYIKVYHDFVVNKAFGFVVTDTDNTILFSGVVNQI